MRAFRPHDEHSALHGIPAEQIAELCKVHVTTARRWKRGEEPPFAALQWIRLAVTGNLGLMDPKWHGWSLKAGKLVAPTGMEFSTGDVLAIPFVQQLVASYQTEQRMPRQGDWIEEKFIPAKPMPRTDFAINE